MEPPPWWKTPPFKQRQSFSLQALRLFPLFLPPLFSPFSTTKKNITGKTLTFPLSALAVSGTASTTGVFISGNGKLPNQRLFPVNLSPGKIIYTSTISGLKSEAVFFSKTSPSTQNQNMINRYIFSPHKISR